jgi:aspartate aminotransferase-like enzyme
LATAAPYKFNLDDERFVFSSFYEKMKSRRFVLYPGKVSNADSFRIGTIGHVFPDDITSLVENVGEVFEEISQGDKVVN